MSRFRKLTQTIWHCLYHIVWVPKYRYRVLQGPISDEVQECIMSFSAQLKCEVEELNMQRDHVHLLAMVLPKVSRSTYVGTLKGRSAISVLRKFRHLKTRPYWGNHFWANGYCVDTVGLNEEMIRRYVKYQEKRERTMRRGDIGL